MPSGASSLVDAENLQPKNHYDRHRTVCTCDDRRQAARLSGHTWNIINNREDHEVYLRHARNSDHYVDATGRATTHWFEQKRRIDADNDGVVDCVDSTNVAEIMTCPQTAGKEAAHLRTRQVRQLCQAAAPGSCADYSACRAASLAPPTPRRKADLERRVPFQGQLRDTHSRPTPRTTDRHQWTSRRAERRVEQQHPQEYELYRKVDQLRAESHVDVVDQSFAVSLHSARSSSHTGATTSALSGANTQRSMHVGRQDQPAKPAAGMTRNSMCRLEATDAREISNWPFRQDKLQRGDPYHTRPMAQSGSSSVKYDIVTNERRQFFY